MHDEKREAERLGFSVRTLQQWRVKGGGPPYFKLGSAVRYDPVQVDSWLDEHTRVDTGPSAGPAPASRARGC
ncbi:helix-turn-helix domain-containing protein [uncultured Lamprocystis sp.]|uniref:helix-turn-helix transcriptional regulator n=1 Tax=uncultured Lamprocystis sp. TaxID=543132 RepID=UPI0025E57626|nr:helix-turn-helix domain-containing protein [uncultured Lamprocystis sp.]